MKPQHGVALWGSILVLCLAALAYVTPGHCAGITFSKLHLSTNSGLYTGSGCTATRLKVDATPFGGGFAIMSCTSWTLGAVQIPVNAGAALSSVQIAGQGTYYDCFFLDQDFGGPVPYIELECRGAFFPSEMFGSGFEGH